MRSRFYAQQCRPGLTVEEKPTAILRETRTSKYSLDDVALESCFLPCTHTALLMRFTAKSLHFICLNCDLILLFF